MSDRIVVIMPALNEADAIPAALEGRPDDLPVIVVDNGSTDGTADVARSLGATVVVEPMRGFGAACWAGVRAATAAEVVVFADADGSFTWPDIARMGAVVADGDADFAIGWRRPDLREDDAMPWHVAVANRILGWVCGRVAGTTLHDLGPLRAIRRDDLIALGVRDRTFGWPLEMVLLAGSEGLRIQEVPITYRVRVGTSKVTGTPFGTLRAATRMLVVLGRFAIDIGLRGRTR